jgi:PAS domain S-box-containing protein/putative nucleotidyltransferase with HDIG domain
LRDLAVQVLASGKNQVVDMECGGSIFSTFITPVSGQGYVNVYGRDVTEGRQAEEALRKSVQDYRRLFDNANDVVLIFEPEHEIILEANAAACAVYGFDHDELVGMSLRSLTRNVGAGTAHIQDFLEGRQQNNFESIHFNKAGEDIHFLINCSLISYDGREAILSINRDITERRRAHEKLRESEEKFKKAFYTSPDSININRLEDGMYVSINHGFTRIMGYSEEDIVGRTSLEMDIWDNPEDRRALIAGLKKNGEVQDLEARFRTKNGNIRDGLMSAALIDLNGTPHIISMTRDITERKRAEQALRESDKRFRALIENSSDAITLLDSQGRVLYDSPSAPGLLGYGDQDWIGREVFELIHPDDLPGIRGLLQTIVQTHRFRVRSTFRLRHKSGAWLWIEAVATNLLAEPGVNAIVVNYHDITERRRADEALREREARYKGLFEDSPIALWEEDFSAVKQRLDALRHDGITNFEEYFAAHPEVVSECAALVKVLDVNNETLALHGATRKEDLLKGLGGVLAGEPIQSFRNELARIAAGATSFHWQGLNKTLDGRLINVSVNWSAAPGYEDSLSRVIVSMIDITERKRAEAERQALLEIMQAAALTESLQEFLELMRQSLGKVLDAENLFVVFHDQRTGLFEEVFSVDKYDAPAPPSGLEKSITSYVFRTGEPLLLTQAKFAELEARGEVELVGNNSASWLGAPLKTPAGPIGVIAIQNYEDPNCYSERDTAFLASIGAQVALAIERRQAEEKLHQSEERFSKAFQSNPAAEVLSRLSDGRIVDVNESYLQFIGYQRDEVLGKSPGELNISSDPYEFEKITRHLNAVGYVANAETTRRSKNGEISDVMLSIVTIELNGQQFALSTLVDITARKHAEAIIQKQVHRLSALRAIDTAISSSLDLRVSLNVLLEHVTAELRVDAAAVLLLNPSLNELEYVASRGFYGTGMSQLRLKLGEDYAGQAALERRIVNIPNLAQAPHPLAKAELTAGEKFVAFFAIPLVAKGQVQGVMEVFHRSRLDPDPEWLDFLETLAGQAAIAIDSAQMFSDLQRSNIELSLAYDATIEGWSRAMDLRDKETEGHTRRVTETSVNLARRMGLPAQELTHVRRGALLHDIGKMGVPDAILLKPGPLTAEEWAAMRQHPTLAYELLAQVRYLQPAINIPYCHHEKWDGTGYPRGLKGEQIPLVARLFAVIDVYDALTSDRPYRPAWSSETAQEYIRSESGKHFDPRAAEVFLNMRATDTSMQ